MPAAADASKAGRKSLVSTLAPRQDWNPSRNAVFMTRTSFLGIAWTSNLLPWHSRQQPHCELTTARARLQTQVQPPSDSRASSRRRVAVDPFAAAVDSA